MKKITMDKLTKEQALLWLRRFVYIVCFVGLTIHLCEYDNKIYQHHKDIQNGIALIFFAVLLFTIQRVKLISWSSLIVSVVMIPYIHFSSYALREAYNIYLIQLFHGIALFLVLLVVADIARSKRTASFARTNLFLLFTFAVMYFYVSFSLQNFSAYPIILLLYFIQIERKEWENITDCLCVAELISFILLLIASFTQPKLVTQQSWYGIFLNIGSFAMFQAINLAFSVFSLIRSRNKFGRKSIPYVISLLWVLADVWVGIIKCGTRTYLSGLLVFALVMFIFYPKSRKNNGRKGRIIRGGIVVGFLLVGLLIGFIWMKTVYSPGFDPEGAIDKVMASPLGKIGKMEHNITRLVGPAYDGGRTGDGMVDPIDGVFEPYTAASFINYFSSGRLRIWKMFLKDTGFQGNPSGGIMVGQYWAFTAHNEYIQHMYRYGIPAGILNIVFIFGAFISAIAGFVKTRKDVFLLPMIYLAVMLGCWFGEAANICFPLTFIGLILIYPVLHRKDMESDEEIIQEETA